MVGDLGECAWEWEWVGRYLHFQKLSKKRRMDLFGGSQNCTLIQNPLNQLTNGPNPIAIGLGGSPAKLK